MADALLTSEPKTRDLALTLGFAAIFIQTASIALVVAHQRGVVDLGLGAVAYEALLVHSTFVLALVASTLLFRATRPSEPRMTVLQVVRAFASLIPLWAVHAGVVPGIFVAGKLGMASPASLLMSAATLSSVFAFCVFFSGFAPSFDRIGSSAGKFYLKFLLIYLIFSPAILFGGFIFIEATGHYSTAVARSIVEGTQVDWAGLVPRTDDAVETFTTHWKFGLVFSILLVVPFVILWLSQRGRNFNRDLTGDEIAFVNRAGDDAETLIDAPVPIWYRAVIWLRRLSFVGAYVLFFLFDIYKAFFTGDYRAEDAFEPLITLPVANPWLVAVAMPFAVIAILHLLSYVWPRLADLEARRAMTSFIFFASWTRVMGRGAVLREVRLGRIPTQSTFSPEAMLLRSYRGGEPYLLAWLVIVIALIDIPIPSEVTDFLLGR